ncbi:MAG: tetratricopeptide repeat protein, partial [Nitrososphaera sp.]|nr:tetratricopeptide repeat protein [Nitrososphaera sp.]
LDPNHGVARLNRGNIHNLRNESDSAVREITRALESLPIGPEQGAAHLSRGNAHLMLGNYREAIGDFSVAAKCYPDTKPKAFCELRKAIALLDSGDHDGAFQAIEASLELDDEAYEAHMFKGQLSLKHGNTKDAIAELTQVLKLGAPDSTVSQALNLRAEAYTNLGHYNLALRDYDRAVELDRSSSAIHYNRGNVLLLTGDVDAAIEAFNHALELDHRNALNSRGIAYALQEDFELAIEDHREATLKFGRSEAAGSAFRNLALCYAIAGNTNSAAESVRRARELDADSPFNEQVEGLVCLYQGRFTDSLALLSRVAGNHNDRPDLKLYLSLPHAFLGDPDEARSLAEECLGKLNPPMIKTQFTTHLRALRDRFPEEKEFMAFSQTFSR